MRKRMTRFVPILIIVLLIAACSTSTPWRKASVTTFELSGEALVLAYKTAGILLENGKITAVQHQEFLVAYGKAKAAYVVAGKALKAASAANTPTSVENFNMKLDVYKSALTAVDNMIIKFQAKP